MQDRSLVGFMFVAETGSQVSTPCPFQSFADMWSFQVRSLLKCGMSGPL